MNVMAMFKKNQKMKAPLLTILRPSMLWKRHCVDTRDRKNVHQQIFCFEATARRDCLKRQLSHVQKKLTDFFKQ